MTAMVVNNIEIIGINLCYLFPTSFLLLEIQDGIPVFVDDDDTPIQFEAFTDTLKLAFLLFSTALCYDSNLVIVQWYFLLFGIVDR